MSSVGEAFGKVVRNQKEHSDSTKDVHPQKDFYSKIYLKAMPLRKLSDLKIIKREVSSGNILIIKVSPLANKSVDDIKNAVNELCEFVKTIDGDIARLGEERVVITPSGVRIWRESSISSEEVPTAA